MRSERRLFWWAFWGEARSVAVEGNPPRADMPELVWDDDDDPILESYARTYMAWMMTRDLSQRNAMRDIEAMILLAEERLDAITRQSSPMPILPGEREH